ncbi:hypothetical protein B0I32_115331 [Nonomuraea fuscirosea]|uniref:Uncharacterized protein n=1 Tax=Nonomuraea fuscirosea TaxID=1291556 RepID=A0A2T0MSM1_9ACTN|nr:hypothetical protein [Nonomuraea fuscirosea]PRX61474.1 hypothetical protein B0I32_115331 [Nonomuraea fuscirosea]
MFGWWTVLPESERQQWILTPFVSVGPLHFGMNPIEATAALGGITTRPQYRDGRVEMARYQKAGLTLHYNVDEKLKAVAIDALRGPQVFADDTALVGRVPSEIEQWMEKRAASRDPCEELAYMNAGEPGSRSLGVVVGVQRAGDRLLTRPVFLPAEAMDDPSHWLPQEAWAIQT